MSQRLGSDTVVRRPATENGTEKAAKPSAVEIIKIDSNYLRGNLAEELASDAACVSKDNTQLIKFHGSYQQDDRDRRDEARAAGVQDGKFYSFMVRSAIPGGRLTSEQLLSELDLCDEVGNTTLRITTRQGLQLHGVLKKDLRRTIARINEVQLTTIAACGDVKRNVMCSPYPYKGDPVYEQLFEMADRLSEAFKPQTPAYHELWLTDLDTGFQQLAGSSRNGHAAGTDPIEPIYGKTYLPRKFKLALGLPGDNSADVYANDIGLLAVCEDFSIVGYNVLVGGSFGVTPSAAKTFPAIAQPLCYAPVDQVIDVCTAIVKVQRDFGNRSDRKIARMKYLINDWGLDRFKAKVEEYYGDALPDPAPMEVREINDGMGWHPQGDGRWFYGLNIENGRIHDTPTMQLKTALREICLTLEPPLRLTPHQSIIFCDLAESDRATIESILRKHRVPLTEDYTAVRRWAMACPALPTCGLAITESERALPGLLDELETELKSLGLENEIFTFRMTGCPNGCARPYNSDIGLVGKTVGKYTIFLGGRRQGDRLNTVYKDLVPHEEVIPTLTRVFRHFRDARQQGEAFGDFCHRVGMEALADKCES